MPRIPILDRYVVAAILPWFFAGAAALMLFWAFNIFFIAADYLVNGHAPLGLILRFVIFRMPQSTPMALPFGCLVGGMLAMGRLVGQNEVTAMRASGVSVWRITLGPLLFGFAAFGLCYWLNESVVPNLVDQSTRSFYQIIYHTDSLPAEQQFFRKDTATQTVFYVTQVLPDNQTLQGVQIFRATHIMPWTETLQAKTALLLPHAMLLQHPIETRYDAKGTMTSQKRVPDVTIPLPGGESAKEFLSSVNSDAWTMSSARLRQQIDALQAEGVGGTALGSLRVNLANKLSWPFACVVGILISVPLALRFSRGGLALGAALSILSLFVYYIMTTAASAFGRTGFMNAYLACWLPNILITCFGLLMLWLEDPLLFLPARRVPLHQPPRPVHQ